MPGLTHTNALVRTVAGGWQISGITSGRSGTQLTVAAGTDRSMTAINRDRADLVSGQDPYTSGACAKKLTGIADDIMTIPAVPDYVSPVLSVIPL